MSDSVSIPPISPPTTPVPADAGTAAGRSSAAGKDTPPFREVLRARTKKEEDSQSALAGALMTAAPVVAAPVMQSTNGLSSASDSVTAAKGASAPAAASTTDAAPAAKADAVSAPATGSLASTQTSALAGQASGQAANPNGAAAQGIAVVSAPQGDPSQGKANVAEAITSALTAAEPVAAPVTAAPSTASAAPVNVPSSTANTAAVKAPASAVSLPAATGTASKAAPLTAQPVAASSTQSAVQPTAAGFGQALTQSTQAVAQVNPGAPALAASVAQQVSQQILTNQATLQIMQGRANGQTNTLFMQITPKDLGNLQIQITRTPQGVEMSVLTELAKTSSLLTHQLNDLRAMLSGAGMTLSQVWIGQAGEESAERQAARFAAQDRASGRKHSLPLPDGSAEGGGDQITAQAIGQSLGRNSLIDYRI